jgi:hypothetical protein
MKVGKHDPIQPIQGQLGLIDAHWSPGANIHQEKVLRRDDRDAGLGAIGIGAKGRSAAADHCLEAVEGFCRATEYQQCPALHDKVLHWREPVSNGSDEGK